MRVDGIFTLISWIIINFWTISVHLFRCFGRLICSWIRADNWRGWRHSFSFLLCFHRFDLGRCRLFYNLFSWFLCLLMHRLPCLISGRFSDLWLLLLLLRYRSWWHGLLRFVLFLMRWWFPLIFIYAFACSLSQIRHGFFTGKVFLLLYDGSVLFWRFLWFLLLVGAVGHFFWLVRGFNSRLQSIHNSFLGFLILCFRLFVRNFDLSVCI